MQHLTDTVIPRAAASLSMDYQGWCGPGDLLLLHRARMKEQIAQQKQISKVHSCFAAARGMTVLDRTGHQTMPPLFMVGLHPF
jgi:hypothetical protein